MIPGMEGVEQLIENLKRGSPESRCKAAEALGRTKDAEATMSLIGILKDEDFTVKLAARDALVRTGTAAVGPLIQALQDVEGWSYVHDALLRIGKPAIQPLIDVLAHEELKSKAAFILFRFGGQAIKPLVQSLGRADIRESVASILSRQATVMYCPVAEPLVKALARSEYRKGVVLAVRQILLTDLQPHMPLLLRVLAVLERKRAIGDIEELARALIPSVVKVLNEPTRHDAARALCMMGTSATPYLLDLIRDKTRSESSRCSAVYVLGETGDPAGVDVLVETLDEKDSPVSLRAVEALAKAGDQKAIVPLLSVLAGGRSALSDRVVEVVAGSSKLKRALAGFNRRSRKFLCGQCLSRFQKQRPESRIRRSIVFFACRECGGVSSAIEDVETVVAVLDREWSGSACDSPDLLHEMEGSVTAPVSIAGAYVRSDCMRYGSSSRTLYVNWSQYRATLDFDQVWVREAREHDVKELIMKVRNDTDTERRKHLRSISLRISPSAKLSAAAVNLLADTFAEAGAADLKNEGVTECQHG